MQEMATRLCGSADLFATDPGRGSTASVNYVACHDGFTMADLTRYRHKHNERNGEDNRDGTNDNHSVNFGYEGPRIGTGCTAPSRRRNSSSSIWCRV